MLTHKLIYLILFLNMSHIRQDLYNRIVLKGEDNGRIGGNKEQETENTLTLIEASSVLKNT